MSNHYPGLRLLDLVAALIEHVAQLGDRFVTAFANETDDDPDHEALA